MKKAALYVRVSKSDGSQTPENQKEPLLRFAEGLDLDVIKTYADKVSGGDSNRPQFKQMLSDARKRKFDVILTWSLDRFSREGISNTLAYLEKLKQYNVAVKSFQESWADTTDEGIGELLIAIFAWVAKKERQRISERTKAGLKRAKKEGRLGQRGKDKNPRKRSGYCLRWEREKAMV